MQEILNNPDVKEAELIRSQALVQLINANITYCVWPRAGGKTSGGIGPRILHLSEVMPGSQILLIADSFERIEKALWPGIEAYLNLELGLVAEVDYVVHKTPPEHFTRPYIKPAKYDHVISFATGFTLCEVSLGVAGSANGYNAQAVIGDEIKYWDEKKFKSEVRPAIRGGMKKWGHLPKFQSLWFFTDKFPSKGANIQWVLGKKKEVNHDDVEDIYTLQLEVLRLQEEAEQLSSNEAKYERYRKIDIMEEVMREKRMNLIYYSDALPYENKENLGEKYFHDQKRDLSAYEYSIAIENKDPDKSQEPFYPTFTEKNLYSANDDINANRSLIIALDYQHNITPVVTAQWGRLNGSPYTTLNFVHSLHALPGDIEEAMRQWCDYFEFMRTKHVFFPYDQTAIGRSPQKKVFKDLVVDYLQIRGWSVTEVYMGDTPDHDIKQASIKNMLNVATDKAIRFNKERNEFLIKSINQTDAKIVNGKTKKDKDSEKSKKVPPEESTHYSDTSDQILHAVIELELVPMTDDPGLDITARG